MNLAVKNYVEECALESIIKRMNNDSAFYGRLVNAINMEDFLQKERYTNVDGETINVLMKISENIKRVVDSRVEQMSVMMSQRLPHAAWGCNGNEW